MQCKSGHIRGVASLEGDSLVVFYHFIASDIWSDKRGSIWWSGLVKERLLNHNSDGPSIFKSDMCINYYKLSLMY